MRGIYELTIDCYVYVGHSDNVRQRHREHQSMLQRGVHDNPKLQSAFDRHGTFEFSVLEEVPAGVDLAEREQHWIDLRLAEVGRRRLLNLNLEANSSPLLNPEIRERQASRLRNKSAEWRNNAATAAAEAQAKTYPGFVSPSGEVYREVRNLRAFCRAHNLDPGAMCNLAKGKMRQFRGWKCIE